MSITWSINRANQPAADPFNIFEHFGFGGFDTGNVSEMVGAGVGAGAGASNITGVNNTFFGFSAGVINTIGSRNTFIGNDCGQANTSGGNNVFIGVHCGFSNVVGTCNVYIGNESGRNSTGNANVFIGKNAGYNETGNSKLYIANSRTATPLIYGDFASAKLRINGEFGVSQPYNIGTVGALTGYLKMSLGGTSIRVPYYAP